jgi:hypothetical protein
LTAKQSRIKEYILSHPDESKAQQALSTGVGVRTIARARADLVAEGLLPADRKVFRRASAQPAGSAQDEVPSEEPRAAASKEPGLRDHAAMKALANLIDSAAGEEDESLIVKRLLKQCLTFAFDPSLHPDTRMSATQQWAKFKDQTKTRTLGPGNPKTQDDAIARLSELDVAVGPTVAVKALTTAYDFRSILLVMLRLAEPAIVISAFNEVYEQKERATDEGQVPADPSPAPPGADGPASA